MAVRDDGAVWINGAGGYVKDGRVVSTTPQFTSPSNQYSLTNTDPSKYLAEQTKKNQGAVQSPMKAPAMPAMKTTTTQNTGSTFGNTNGPLNNQPAVQTNPYQQQPTVNPYQQPLYNNIDMASLMAQYMPKSSYIPKTEEELLAEATQYANLEIDPQASALQKSLKAALLANENQRKDVDAAYATVGATANRLLDDAAKRATESAIARGGGRSGAVEHEREKLSSPIMEKVAQAEAQKSTDLSKIAANIANAQQTVADTQVELESRKGELVAQKLASLKEYEQAKQIGDESRAMEILKTMSNIDIAYKNLQLSAADLMGELPSNSAGYANDLINDMSNSSNSNQGSGNSVGLRQYAESKGATVNWDPSTQSVSINNNTFSPAQLQASGAQLIDGRWYIPESTLLQMMGY